MFIRAGTFIRISTVSLGLGLDSQQSLTCAELWRRLHTEDIECHTWLAVTAEIFKSN